MGDAVATGSQYKQLAESDSIFEEGETRNAPQKYKNLTFGQNLVTRYARNVSHFPCIVTSGLRFIVHRTRFGASPRAGTGARSEIL